MDSFSKRLNEAMEMRNIKQVDLVEMTGITKGAISSYVNGDYIPKQINTHKIAKALNVDPAWLMGKDINADNHNVEKYLNMIHEKPGLRVLLDSTNKLTEEDIEALIKMIDTFKNR